MEDGGMEEHAQTQHEFSKFEVDATHSHVEDYDIVVTNVFTRWEKKIIT